MPSFEALGDIFTRLSGFDSPKGSSNTFKTHKNISLYFKRKYLIIHNYYLKMEHSWTLSHGISINKEPEKVRVGLKGSQDYCSFSNSQFLNSGDCHEVNVITITTRENNPIAVRHHGAAQQPRSQGI